MLVLGWYGLSGFKGVQRAAGGLECGNGAVENARYIG